MTLQETADMMQAIARTVNKISESYAGHLRSFAESFQTSATTEDQQDLRSIALAAKQGRGQGPPAPPGWRGRERTTKYQRR